MRSKGHFRVYTRLSKRSAWQGSISGVDKIIKAKCVVRATFGCIQDYQSEVRKGSISSVDKIIKVKCVAKATFGCLQDYQSEVRSKGHSQV